MILWRLKRSPDNSSGEKSTALAVVVFNVLKKLVRNEFTALLRRWHTARDAQRNRRSEAKRRPVAVIALRRETSQFERQLSPRPVVRILPGPGLRQAGNWSPAELPPKDSEASGRNNGHTTDCDIRLYPFDVCSCGLISND